VSHHLSTLFVAVALGLATIAASAQNAPMMGGSAKGGDMEGGVQGRRAVMDNPALRMIGLTEQSMNLMLDNMARTHEWLAHFGDRIAFLKTQLEITEEQTPAWNNFADALLAAAKSADDLIESTPKQFMVSATASLSREIRPACKNCCRQRCESEGNQGYARSPIHLVQR
jgi:LTXXQ motif family protein